MERNAMFFFYDALSYLHFLFILRFESHTHTPNHIIVFHLVFNIFITVHFVHCLIYDIYIDLKKGSFFLLSWFFHVFTLKSVFSFHVSCVSAGPYIVYIDKNKIKWDRERKIQFNSKKKAHTQKNRRRFLNKNMRLKKKRAHTLAEEKDSLLIPKKKTHYERENIKLKKK